MRKMKDSGVAWLGEIPEDWAVVFNKHLMKKVKCIREKYTGEDVLSLTMKGVLIRDLDNPSGKMPATFDGYQFVEAGNLLMCLFDIDVTPRCIGLIKNDGVCSPAYSQFKLNDLADAGYYYYYYLNLDNTKELLHLAKNLRHSLTEEQFGSIPTALPPLDVQKKISHKLERKVSEADALITNVQAQIEKLKAYKQSLITEVVTKGLDPNVPMKDSSVEWIGEIPSSWNTIRVKQLLRERKERSVDGKEEPLSMSQKVGLVPTKTLDSIPNMASSFVGAKLAYVDDLVFNKLKAHLGVFSVSKYDGLVSPDYAVYYSTGVADLKYLEYLFKTPQCISEFRKRSTGIAAGLTRLYTDGLFAIECPFPSKDKQHEIVAHLNKKCAQIDELTAIKQTKIEKLEQYKRSLIYEYVTGKKEVS
ncbi:MULTISPECIES: restriction endonuclease subunit S [Faecalibacterium]|uniref:restriction endonuclease subunit S n=1 Tax=Faecalibacterium TaxID=216851 RepID=UPI000E534D93|nr:MULTISPECIES: restriction endonuclease subunit S [Faecalibacterium]RHQ26453.1 restriction endonuclease subunit S [Faecalibacterium sp. AF28-13AC]